MRRMDRGREGTIGVRHKYRTSVGANRYIEAFVLGRLCKRIPPD